MCNNLTKINDNELNIKKIIEKIVSCLPKDYDNRDIVFQKLCEIVIENNLIDISYYVTQNYGKIKYIKYPIYESKDSKFPFSLFILVFATGQETSIHDHQVNCNTIVLSKTPIVQNNYRIIQKNAKNIIEELPSKLREKGDIDYDKAKSGFAHRLSHPNTAKTSSVTMHMYYCDIDQTSICTIYEDKSILFARL